MLRPNRSEGARCGHEIGAVVAIHAINQPEAISSGPSHCNGVWRSSLVETKYTKTIDQYLTNRRWSSNVASSQHDRSSRTAVLKVIYLLVVTAVTFMVPALSATRPLRW